MQHWISVLLPMVSSLQVQQQLIGFIPEVASPDEHERVVQALFG